MVAGGVCKDAGGWFSAPDLRGIQGYAQLSTRKLMIGGDANMAGLSAREASERVGLTKQAVLKAIKIGRLSAEKDANGEWRIDPAELFRVYPAIAKVDDNQPPTGDAPGLQRENELLRDQVEDLRRRLDQSEEERRQVQARLTGLLTDQRPAPLPTERRGWWPWRRRG